jgi:hypothetical protein
VRIVGILGFGLLSAAVVAEGAYIVKTRRQMTVLSEQVQELASEVSEAPASGGRPAAAWTRPVGTSPAGDEGDPGAAGGAARLPPPRFVPAPEPQAPVALPAAFDNPQAREQLRQFIAAELERERQERRDREQQRREQERQERLQATIKSLGLNEPEAKRFREALAQADTARQELRQKIEGGQLQRQDIGREFQALRQRTDEQLKQAIGEDRMKKLQEMQRQDRRGWFGGDRGGGDRGGGDRGGGDRGGERGERRQRGPEGGGPPPPPTQ